ncbi:MAG: hypothetical protein JNN07_17775 [Verrucomicrobiales bacterium]|nr:hypothetical protein [Verrucomicrobiales bacterium]
MPLINTRLPQSRRAYAYAYGLLLVATTGAALLSAPLPAMATSPVRTSGAVASFPAPLEAAREDWLLQTRPTRSSATSDASGKIWVLDNGLVRRVFRTSPNATTTGLDDLRTGQGLLRSVRPDTELVLNGKRYPVGGLSGQPNHAYLTEAWLNSLTNIPGAFQWERTEMGEPSAPLVWKKKRPAAPQEWPPRGKALRFSYRGTDELTKELIVTVHHEIYDGIPVLGKYLTIENTSKRPVTIDRLSNEILALVETESAVDTRERHQWLPGPLDVLSDYMFKGMDPVTANRVASWEKDPAYTTQVSYELQTPCLLVCQPPVGPGVTLQPGERFTGFRTYLVIYDSTERERRSLTLRRAWRTLAPWTTENPIMMHVASSKTEIFRRAVDQCAEVGFEMIIYTFGSGLNMENQDPAYLARIKADVDYAHSRGLQVGAYSLFSSRRISEEHDVINPATGKPGGAIFGNAPCLASRWGLDYLSKVTNFLAQTGLDLLEHDGPYPGDVCASTTHPGHHAAADSQWAQWTLSKQLYSWCREQGIYVNQPDCYFLAGGNKTGMGYREVNWSLPRAQQLIHARQNIFDGTWNKGSSMGWMFVPLTEYHGGGPAATIEPLKDHLKDYELHFVNTLGAGVQACFRGPRLYDTDETKAVVARWVSWYKQYRDILESDLIHARRANGRDLDFYLHVNPGLDRKAMVVLFNPRTEVVSQNLRLPLYYTGLTRTATARREAGKGQRLQLDRQGTADLQVQVPAEGVTWYLIE